MSSTVDPRRLRVLPASAEPADVQLASGPALLAGLETTRSSAMRWLEFRPPALLLGSSQRGSEIDFDACRADDIPVYRRRSGGGAVLSEGLVLLDLALPRTHRLFINDVTESYRWFGATWAAALRSLGLAARTVAVEEARADTRQLDPLTKRVCFGGLSPYEVVVEGRKVVGLAQVRRRQGCLLQAGIYRQWPAERTAALLLASPPERAALATRLASRVAGLAEVQGGREVAVPALQAAVADALAQRNGYEPAPDEWLPAEQAERERETAQYERIANAAR